MANFDFVDVLLLIRYNNLSEPLQNRRETLEAWQVLFQFYRDLEEEVAWLSDRLPSVTAKDLGSSQSSTQQLLHKHQVLKKHSCKQTADKLWTNC